MSNENLKAKFVDFVKELDEKQLRAMCEARSNISFDGSVFYTLPRNHRDEREGVAVYDSDGQADSPIAPSTLRAQLISDAEGLLQGAFHYGC